MLAPRAFFVPAEGGNTVGSSFDDSRYLTKTMELRAAEMSYSVRRYYVDEFMARHVGALPRGSRVIDVAGHKTTKRGQFDIGKYDVSVIYVNLVTDKGCDVQADAAALPLRNETFDVAICSELLEHVPDPYAVVREAARILRHGGIVLICAPFLYRLHGAPADFGRYTDSFWQQCLRSAGFTDITIERQGLFWSVVADFFKQYTNELAPPGYFGRIVKHLARRVVTVLAWRAVPHDQDVRVLSDPFLRSFTTGFGIKAIKR